MGRDGLDVELMSLSVAGLGRKAIFYDSFLCSTVSRLFLLSCKDPRKDLLTAGFDENSDQEVNILELGANAASFNFQRKNRIARVLRYV